MNALEVSSVRFASLGLGLAALLLFGSSATVNAETITQISDPFSQTLYLGSPVAFSQVDLGATAPLLSEFANAYDNFVLNTDTVLKSISWVGAYQTQPPTGPLAGDFTVGLYQSIQTVPGVDEPGALIQSFDVGTAGESLISGTVFYQYTAEIDPFAVTAGETFWISIVANQNFSENGWGLAYSSLGDGDSFQDIQTDPTIAQRSRFRDPVDYAINVTAVPEPSTLLSCLGVAGLIARRRRTNGG